MSASTTYTPLRDDTSHRSLSKNEANFLRSCALGILPSSSHAASQQQSHSQAPRQGSVLRTDGRSAGDSRPIRLSFSRSHNASECTVQFGAHTRVTSAVTCQLIPPPHADRPNDGSIVFSVDLSPMAAMGFEYAQPSSTLSSNLSGGMGQAQNDGQKLLSNRILRILERTMLQGGAIDAEALCVQSGKWVWRLTVDVTVLDHGGNLVDACVLSAVAALRHFRKPEVQVEEGNANGNNNSDGRGGGSGSVIVQHSDEKEPTPLPLHHTPLTVTFALFADPSGASTDVSALIDPSHREELVMDGTSTFSFNKYGEMCSLDFPGGCELKPRQLIMCATLGKKKCLELCDILETTLQDADVKAVQERLDRLKLAAGKFADGDENKNVPLPDIAENVPFVERTDYERDGDMMEVEVDLDGSKYDDERKKAAAIAAAEEESYRIQALDYSLGHVAAKVKENDSSSRGAGSKQRKGPIFGGSLMAAMLQSAGTEESSTANDDEDDLQELQIKTKKSKTSSSALSSRRTQAADEEFAKLVQEESSKGDRKDATTVATATAMALDSDEEEETTMLQSEFGTFPSTSNTTEQLPSPTTKATKTKTRVVKEDDDNDDVDDLAMAVKKKPKGKKKKKSKK